MAALGRRFEFAEKRTVRANQAVAWNRSITGTKSEDTMVARADGPELISRPTDWPTVAARVEAGTIERADILVL